MMLCCCDVKWCDVMYSFECHVVPLVSWWILEWRKKSTSSFENKNLGAEKNGQLMRRLPARSRLLDEICWRIQWHISSNGIFRWIMIVIVPMSQLNTLFRVESSHGDLILVEKSGTDEQPRHCHWRPATGDGEPAHEEDSIRVFLKEANFLTTSRSNTSNANSNNNDNLNEILSRSERFFSSARSPLAPAQRNAGMSPRGS